jgi:hypothetical protein
MGSIMTNSPFQLPMVLIGLLVLVLQPGRAMAEEVHWRHDYKAARQEARDQNRLLILDFGTKNCFWCKKLDASTFRDPEVVKLLNKHFVPLKLDGEREAKLVHTLNITSYPTLVFAAPEGKILAVQEGFEEAAAFSERLRRLLAETGPQIKPLEEAQPQLARTTASGGPQPTGSNPNLRAGKLLTQAKADCDDQLYICCLERCRVLIAQYPDSPEALEARRLAGRIKGDPIVARQASTNLAKLFGELCSELAGGDSTPVNQVSAQAP